MDFVAFVLGFSDGSVASVIDLQGFSKSLSVLLYALCSD